MKNSVLFALLFVSSLICHGQDSTRIRAKQAVYVEVGGTGLGISLNYDRILKQSLKWKYGARVGVGINSGEFRPMPIAEVYALKGKNGKYLELGFGATYRFSTSFQYTVDSTLVSGRGGNQLWLMPRVGYRRQKSDKGNIFRVGLTPVFTRRSEKLFVTPFLGISFGRNF